MKIKSWRLSEGLTQGQFAKIIGTTDVAVSRYESGRVPSPRILQKIMRATGGNVTANDWFVCEYPAAPLEISK